MAESQARIFFPGLNGLRFIAAFAVIITHTELLKSAFGIQHYWYQPVVSELGVWGVDFFFVLSGFLITYLLFAEQEHRGSISVKAFYLRRVLRIWPLYYFMLVLGFFVLPHIDAMDIQYLEKDFHEHFWGQLMAYTFIAPNLATAMYMAVPHIGQLWSIGVEEQFYLAWPWLVRSKIGKVKLMIGIIVGLILVKAAALLLAMQFPDSGGLAVFKILLSTMKFECMAIGALGALVLYQRKEALLKIIYHPAVFLLAFTVAPALLFWAPKQFQDGYFMLNAVAFLIIILNVSTNPKCWLKMENPVFHHLGKISYGIYMYHMCLIPVVILALKPLLSTVEPPLWWNALLYVSVLGLTIVCATLSYNYLERFFLKLKNRFTTIHSGK